jgi:hypothetical protein
VIRFRSLASAAPIILLTLLGAACSKPTAGGSIVAYTVGVTDIQARSATVRIAIDQEDDDSELVFRGACISTDPAGYLTIAPSTRPESCRQSDQNALVTFTGLEPATTYHVWAHANTIRSTGIGERLSFTTLPEPGITVTADPATLSVAQGGSAATVLRVTRTGGYTGSISTQVTGLPSGLTATGGAIGTGSSAALTFAASANPAVPTGTYTATVTLSGPQLTPRSTSVAVTVTPAPGGFSIGVNPTTLTLQPGGAAGSSTVNVSRTGAFTGAVSLTVSGVPANVDADVTSPGSGASGTVRFTARAGAAAGTSTVTVTATSPGLPNQTATLALTVGAAPAVSLRLDAPTQVQVTRGGLSDITIGTFRTGWTGTVSFQVSGAPMGMTAQMSPASTTGNSSVLKLDIGNVTPNTYTLTVRGTGENGTSATANIAVQVLP